MSMIMLPSCFIAWLREHDLQVSKGVIYNSDGIILASHAKRPQVEVVTLLPKAERFFLNAKVINPMHVKVGLYYPHIVHEGGALVVGFLDAYAN